jgi:uncharacterized membrane protein (DUF106 family)
MDEQSKNTFEAVMANFVEVVSGLSMLLAFVVVIPLFLWFAWAHKTSNVNSILTTLFCLAFAWVFVSMSQCFRSLRKLGLSPRARMRLFSGFRPDDPDELRAWQWGWHFMYAVIAVLLCMLAIPAAWWLTGK